MTQKDLTTPNHHNPLLRRQLADIQKRYEEKIGELSIIREMGSSLLFLRSFEQACRFILNVVIENTVARNCSIMLLDPDSNRLFLAAAADPDREPFVIEPGKVFSRADVHYTFEYGQGAAGRALKEGTSILIADVTHSAEFTRDPACRVRIGSLLAVPLIVENRPLGVLNLSHTRKDAFDQSERTLFEIMANFVALSIHSTLNYERLEASERKYRSLAENLGDGVAILQRGAHVYANPRYLHITGRSIDVLKDTDVELLLDPSCIHAYRQVIGSLTPACSPGRPFEVRLVKEDSGGVDVEISASAFEYNGEPALMIAVRDVTERKALERRVEEARKMEALGTMAGGVAHDLNNVLAGLVSYPELMLMELPDNSPLRDPLLTVKKSGVKAARIVQDLLTLARRGVEIREVVNLNQIVTEYLKTPEYRALLEYHPGIGLETRLDPRLKNIKGSSVHLSKALMNLVSNAAEAMEEPGQILVTTRNVRGEKPPCEPEGPGLGEQVALSVTDRGTGIRPEDMDRIYEPFYTKKVMGRSGTGLGMTVVKGTVEDHHGTIRIQSDLGKGSTFSLFFPVTSEHGPSDTSSHSSKKPLQGRGERILVVDDMEEQGYIASAMLQRLGYEARWVSSGEEAVKISAERPPDLVLLDVIMDPGMDGAETYRELLRIHPGLRTVMTSGYSETDRVRKALSMGKGVFLRKPYTVQDLGEAVRQVLDA